jgi:hypothetical protein
MQLEFIDILNESRRMEVAETQLVLDLPKEEPPMVVDMGMNFDDFGGKSADNKKKDGESRLVTNMSVNATKTYLLSFFYDSAFLGGFILKDGYVDFEGNLGESAKCFGRFMNNLGLNKMS